MLYVRNEIFLTLQYMIIRAFNVSYATFAVSLIMFSVFATYISINPDAQLTPRKVFVSLSLITYVRVTSIHIALIAVQLLSDLRISLKRITVCYCNCMHFYDTIIFPRIFCFWMSFEKLGFYHVQVNFIVVDLLQ